MGLFGKAPLEDDFERALFGSDADNANRNIVSKSQAIIRNALAAGEELRMVAPEDFTGSRTVVVTSQRVLVFKNRFGSGVSKSLENQCDRRELNGVVLQQTGTGSYDAVIQGVGFVARIKIREYLKGQALVQATEELQAG